MAIRAKNWAVAQPREIHLIFPVGSGAAERDRHLQAPRSGDAVAPTLSSFETKMLHRAERLQLADTDAAQYDADGACELTTHRSGASSVRRDA